MGLDLVRAPHHSRLTSALTGGGASLNLSAYEQCCSISTPRFQLLRGPSLRKLPLSRGSSRSHTGSSIQMIKLLIGVRAVGKWNEGCRWNMHRWLQTLAAKGKYSLKYAVQLRREINTSPYISLLSDRFSTYKFAVPSCGTAKSSLINTPPHARYEELCNFVLRVLRNIVFCKY